MRRFLLPTLVASSIVSGFAIDPATSTEEYKERDVEDPTTSSFSHATVNVKLPPELAIADDQLSLDLNVLESETSCGFGSLLIDGQELSQASEAGGSSGNGVLSTANGHAVTGSWSFSCIQVEGQLDSQSLEFAIHAVNGNPVEGTGFSVIFQQKGAPQIIEAVPNLKSTEAEDSFEPSLEEELAELGYLQTQLRELEYLILKKKLAIAAHSDRYSNSITECQNLKCVAQIVGLKLKQLATILSIWEIKEASGIEETKRFPKHHWPKPPFHHGKPGNHTCGPPKHGKGNHTHPHPPPPHFKKPRLPLPICRYPPPPHHGPGHKRPPHHGPPSHHRPGGEHPPHRGPPPPHGPEDHPPPHRGEPHPAPSHHREPHRKPSQSFFQFSENNNGDMEHLPARPHPGPPRRHPAPHDDHHPRHRGPRPHIFGLVAFTFVILFTFIHRRICNPSNRAARRARRAERALRRSRRHAARKQAISNFLCRLGYRRTSPGEDDEKHSLLRDGDADSTMTDEIAGFKCAAEMVSDLIAVEEGRVMHAQELEGEGEGLPAYEDSEGSTMGSVVDGCRFTPGSSDYTPSVAGSAGDIWEVDGKH